MLNKRMKQIMKVGKLVDVDRYVTFAVDIICRSNFQLSLII